MAAGNMPDGSRRAPDSARAPPDALLTMREWVCCLKYLKLAGLNLPALRPSRHLCGSPLAAPKHPANFMRRARGAEQVSLHLRASERLHGLALLFRLDAFRGRYH